MASQSSPASKAATPAAAAACAAQRIGQRYRVLERLGRGGTAIVYRVRDTSRGESFALKQLVLQEPGRDRDMRAQFEREYYVLAQLSHPSVIEVHDFGIDVAGPYYTMELLDSGDLSSGAPWPYQAACQLMGQVCSALSLLHARRLLHRDISPRNVRSTRRGSAKLIDFGAMVPMGPAAQVVGTPGFVAPEVVHHLALDARTDLFSLGATLYFALTGRKPFVARSFAELSEAWREEPLPPSQLVPGIPAALDALVLALLRIDPAGRPRSTFEVMQRLLAIGAGSYAEPEHIAQAYLSTPALLGRDAQQRRFRQRLSQALQGTGGALIFEGEPGSGRSRLLDACVIEAKIAGATVLRVNGRATHATPLATAYGLAEQLLEKLPELAACCAREARVADTLFQTQARATADGSAPVPQLRALEELVGHRYEVQGELSLWFRAMSERQPLVLAVDDLERIDQASIAWLSTLAHEAHLLLVATLQSSTDLTARPALKVLRSHANEMLLAPLSAAQTEALFASIFSDAPQVALVSNRVHRLAAGNPRESMTLTRYMLDRRLIRYAEGNWILPSELAVGELPASAEAAVRECVTTLCELPRRFAETQAVALEEPWTRADYRALAQHDEQTQVDDAVATLVSQGILVGDGSTYTLSHRGVRACLVAGMTEARRTERHLELAELCAQSGRAVMVEVHHRLLAGNVEQGLDRLAWLLERTTSLAGLFENAADRWVVAEVLEHAQQLARARQRPAREVYELTRLLVELSVTCDQALYQRHAPTWLAQLQRDSGFDDYELTSRELAADKRIQLAMQRASARFAATPVRDRVYGSAEAIKQLGHFVALSTIIAARTSDTRLYAALPSQLEPFSGLSPLLNALFQAAVAAAEMNCRAQPEQARTRMRAVHAQLEQVPRADFQYLDTVTSAIAQAVAVLEVTLGYPTAEHWIQLMERDPRHRLSGLHLRRMLCIFDGDTEGADRYRKQAELLAIQTDGYGAIPARLLLELAAHLHAGDLTGVKYVADRTEQLAVKAPGWLALRHLAHASFQRLRGDLPAALDGLERALALADPSRCDPPPQLNVWLLAAAEYVTCLTELDRASDAFAFGTSACERCNALELTGSVTLVHALALAEAKLGRYEAAAWRVEQSIAARLHVRPSLLAAVYAARACVAIAAKDQAAAARFVRLATSQHSGGAAAKPLAKHSRLLDAAKLAGLELDVPASGFESAVLGQRKSVPVAPSPSPLLASLERLSESSARAQRVLELLVAAAGARAGHLYYVQRASLVRVATLTAAPEPALDAFSNDYFLQQLELADMTTVFTEQAGTEPELATWSRQADAVYRLALLRRAPTDTCIGLVALCDVPDSALSAEYRSLSSALCARLLELGDVARSAPFGASANTTTK